MFLSVCSHRLVYMNTNKTVVIKSKISWYYDDQQLHGSILVFRCKHNLIILIRNVLVLINHIY